MKYIYWEETTEEIYDKMLSVLPPIDFNGRSFLVGEPCTHRKCSLDQHVDGGFVPTYQGYLAIQTKDETKFNFYATNTDVTRAEFRALLKTRP